MTNTKTRTGKIKTRIIATALAAISAFSAGSLAMTTVSAAPVAVESVQSAASDGFFSGAAALVSLLSKSYPAAGIVSSGLLAAFKTFYHDATAKPQPTTQDIVNLLNQLSAKIDSHYNAQASQLKALEAISRLQNFANILTSVKGCNEKALGQISLYREDDVCDQDYNNIIKCTSGDKQYVKDFMNLSILISDGQPEIKAKPSFMQYLEYSKACEENNKDAAVIKKDCEMFNRMTLEQYTLYFTNLITGCLAEYNLAEYQYQHNQLSLANKKSTQRSILSDMQTYFNKAQNVVTRYNQATEAIKNLTVAKVSANGKTTEMFSFGDAWVTVSQNGGTMQLVQDWNSDNLAGDVFFHKANECFKNGALYVNGKNVTLDLNGHSIIHKNALSYDLCADNATLTLKDSTDKRGAVNGILATGGSVTVNGVTIRESADAGIRANYLSLNIKNTTFLNNRNSAVVTETGANTTIDNCLFKTNYESALFNKDSTVTVTNSTFEDNRSDSGAGDSKKGGAIYSHDRMNVHNCRFVSNKAGTGGAIFADGTTNITGSAFSGNTARGNGGAIMFDYRGSDWCMPLSINDTTFTENRAGDNGGALYCDSMNYLSLRNVEITNNVAASNGGGLYCDKGGESSCDPTINGKITIIGNRLDNGTASNAFLGENTTSKCIFTITDNIDPSSRIGVTSPTTDKDLDICKIFSKEVYDNAANVFSYDTNAYRINRYTHFYSNLWWVEIVKN